MTDTPGVADYSADQQITTPAAPTTTVEDAPAPASPEFTATVETDADAFIASIEADGTVLPEMTKQEIRYSFAYMGR